MTDDRTQMSDTLAPEHDEAYCSACNQSFGLDRDICPNDGARLIKLRATKDVLLGRVFDGRYELLAALGQGGMGTVYRAHQISVDREVAIKVIHPKLTSDRVAVKRFLREARLASRLSQPNIVNVYDFGQTDDGILYLVMELLRGHTLSQELEAMRALPLRRIQRIAMQICDALAVAHGQGIVHRDLKPSNIIVLDDPPGRDLIKVLDFGLAKSLATDTTSLITASSAILGTPLYMPPEQIGGEQSDQRADLYALGCILYQMLGGRPPFVRENVNLLLTAHMHETAPPLPETVPAPLAALVEQMMKKAPADRPASATRVHAVLDALTELGAERLDQTPVPRRVATPVPGDASASDALAATAAPLARAPVTSPPPSSRTSRWPWLVVAGVAIAGAGVAIALRGHEHATTPADAAAPRVVVVDAAMPLSADAGVSVDAVPVDAAVVPDAPAMHRHPASTPRAPDAAIDAPATADAAMRVQADAGLPPIDFAH